MSRDEMSPAELVALERILAREQVGEEHLELAALVDSVRASAPRMDPAFLERLDGEVAARVARARRPRRTPRLDPRRLALAGGGLVAAAVAFTIVISGGLLDGSTQPAAKHGLSVSRLGPARVPAAAADRTFGAAAGSAASTPAGRLVARDSTLVLATSGSSVQRVANGVVAHTEALGGVVANSFVTLQGARSEAVFSLRVPSSRLATLVAALSSLASVRSLNQDTNDITDAYDQATGRLAEQRAARASLLQADRRRPDRDRGRHAAAPAARAGREDRRAGPHGRPPARRGPYRDDSRSRCSPRPPSPTTRRPPAARSRARSRRPCTRSSRSSPSHWSCSRSSCRSR